MKKLRLLTFWFALAAIACDPQSSAIRSASQPIVTGSDATIADHPWQVTLQEAQSGRPRPGDLICGGALIAPEVVVTAAHCVDRRSSREIQVVAGTSDISGMTTGQIRYVREVAIHPDWERAEDTAEGDLALLFVEQPFRPCHRAGAPTQALVRAVDIATTEQREAGLTNLGVEVTLTGWGRIEDNGPFPGTLQHAAASIHYGGGRRNPYSITVFDRSPAGEPLTICDRDSGSALVIDDDQGKPWLAGVASRGQANQRGDSCFGRAYYVRVSRYAEWIAEHLPTAVGTTLQAASRRARSSDATCADGIQFSGHVRIAPADARAVRQQCGHIATARQKLGRDYGAFEVIALMTEFEELLQRAQIVRGDVNLDGMVGFADFLTIGTHFGEAGGWSVGDFDCDGLVTFDDFLVFAAQVGNFASGVTDVVLPPAS